MASTLFSLPTIIESVFASYIASNYAGSYSINQGFSIAPYSLPLIMVKAGRLVEENPFTHVYKGELNISIHTQADDPGSNVVTIHDNTVATVYDIIFNLPAIMLYANNPGNHLHFYNYYNTGYDQEVNLNEERSLVTLFTFAFHAQTLEINQPINTDDTNGGLSQ